MPTTIAGYGITDAFDGAYDNLSNTPTIPTNNNQLTNGEGYTTNTGTVTSVDSGTGLTGGPITGTGTLNVDVGTGANQIVQLDSNANLPAIDGSQLTNLPAQSFSSITGKPTTIAGYGITDTFFSGSYADLTNKPTLFDGAYSSLTGTPTTISGYGITDGVTLTGTETITDKTIKNPVMRQITGDPSFGAFSGDRLQFTTNYQGSWTYGSTGPAENWNTDFFTKSWQDPGNGWVNVWQLATA